MSEFVLTPAERRFLQALADLGVSYLIVGMGAALLEGAHGTTQDLDIWLDPVAPEALQEAARRAGGFYVASFGTQPPTIGGEGLDRIDLVMAAQGLDAFQVEYGNALAYDIEGVVVRLLPLERVIASKRAAGRHKDLAQLPALEAALAAKQAD